MCLVIDDPVETLRVEWVTARKSHTCEECRRSIEPGERYFLHVAVSDYTGGIDQWKMCAHCSALIDVGCELTGCPRTWYWGEVLDLFPDDLGFVGDILSHHLPPGGRFRFLRLVVAAQRRWRSRSGELLPIPALLTEGETENHDYQICTNCHRVMGIDSDPDRGCPRGAAHEWALAVVSDCPFITYTPTGRVTPKRVREADLACRESDDHGGHHYGDARRRHFDPPTREGETDGD